MVPAHSLTVTWLKFSLLTFYFQTATGPYPDGPIMILTAVEQHVSYIAEDCHSLLESREELREIEEL